MAASRTPEISCWEMEMEIKQLGERGRTKIQCFEGPPSSTYTPWNNLPIPKLWGSSSRKLVPLLCQDSSGLPDTPLHLLCPTAWSSRPRQRISLGPSSNPEHSHGPCRTGSGSTISQGANGPQGPQTDLRVHIVIGHFSSVGKLREAETSSVR